MLIGKALKPLAKIKRAGWNAMGRAFTKAKEAVNPMRSFTKLFEVFGMILLPLTYLITILAAKLAVALMPLIQQLILLVVEYGDELATLVRWIVIVIGWVITFFGWLRKLGDAIGNWLDDVEAAWVKFWENWYDILEKWWYSIIDTLILGCDFLYKEWVGFWSDLYDAVTDWVQRIIDAITGADDGGDGGNEREPSIWDIFTPQGGQYAHSGGLVPRTGWYKLQAQERVIDKHDARGGGGTTINIDMRGAIIDDRDKLITDIVEQVTMRIW